MSSVVSVSWASVLFIFCAATAIRIIVAASLWDLPLVRTPKLDAAEYLAWAERLASGDWSWPAVAQHAPGYPLFLAALLVLGSGSLKLVMIAQALVGACTAVLVSAAAARWFGGRAGLAAGLTYALYGPAVYIDTAILSEGLLLFLLSAALWQIASMEQFADDVAHEEGTAASGLRAGSLTRTASSGAARASGARGETPRSNAIFRADVRRAAIAGLAFGAAALVRPTALVIAAASAVGVAIVAARHGGDGLADDRRARHGDGHVDRRRARALAQVAAIAIACVAVLTPALVKNWRTSRTLSLQGYGGLNVYIGDSPLHDGRATFRLGAGWDALNADASRAGVGDPAAQDRYYLAKTWREIAAHPAAFVRLIGSKALWLVQAVELRDSHSYSFFTEQSALLRVLPRFALLFPIACVGFVAIARPKRRAAVRSDVSGGARATHRPTLRPSAILLFCYVAGAALTVVLLVVGFRYRMPLVPALAIAAGAAVASLNEVGPGSDPGPTQVRPPSGESRGRAQDVGPSSSATGTRVSTRDTAMARSSTSVSPSHTPRSDRGPTSVRPRSVGAAAVVAGAAILISHLRADPRSLNTAEEWAFTGSALVTEHRLADAETAYRTALDRDPRSGLAWDGLGLTLYDARRLAESRDALRRAIEIDPDSARAAFHLALLDEREGRPSDAADGYRRALALSPFDADIARHLGEALLVLNRPAEAVAPLRQAASQSPTDADAHRQLALALGMSHRTAEARDAMRRAVEIAPSSGEAWLDLCLLSLDLNDRDAAAAALQRARELGADRDRLAFAADALARTAPRR